MDVRKTLYVPAVLTMNQQLPNTYPLYISYDFIYNRQVNNYNTPRS